MYNDFMTKPQTVDEYIAQAPEIAQDKLRELRSILQSVAPHATEAIKWGTPVMEQKRILYSYSAFRTHINFMPTRSTLSHFAGKLKAYTVGKDTVQFTYDTDLPAELIREMAVYRLHEVQEDNALWMHHD